jgi:hypothetical protein
MTPLAMTCATTTARKPRDSLSAVSMALPSWIALVPPPRPTGKSPDGTN